MCLGLTLVLTIADLPAASVTGQAIEVASNIRHPNGNIYDQVLLQGTSATIRNDPDQITRISFIDLSDDIVQVEFGGAGSLTVTLESATGPAPAVNYHQPSVLYMRGMATVRISGSDATTWLTIFSVGRITALDQTLFHSDVTYDGWADLALVDIVPNPENPNGSTFGGIRAGNTHFWATKGYAGIWAPSIQLQDSVLVSDVSAYDDATPVLVFGRFSQFGLVRVAGGLLKQPNGRALVLDYRCSIAMTSGTNSHGLVIPGPPPGPVSFCQFQGLDGNLVTVSAYGGG